MQSRQETLDLAAPVGKVSPAFELKGRLQSLTRLRLLTADPAAIRAHLERLAREMPDAVRGMPVVLEAGFAVDVPAVCAELRAAGLQLLAVTEGPLAEAARKGGLAVLPDEGAPRAKAPAAAARKGTRIVDQPVRSGQQVYAEGADLVVTAAVSAGAELIADGCVHAYG